MNRAVAFVAILILAVVLVRSYLRSAPLPGPKPLPIVVDVQGNVRYPGVYLLDGPSATAENGVEAAGGIPGVKAADIPESVFHLEVHTGQAVSALRSEAGEVRVEIRPMQASARLTLGLKLDINTATEEELSVVPHMRRELAAAIVSRRNRKPWNTLWDLEEIRGVGLGTLEKWKNYLEVAK